MGRTQEYGCLGRGWGPWALNSVPVVLSWQSRAPRQLRRRCVASVICAWRCGAPAAASDEAATQPAHCRELIDREGALGKRARARHFVIEVLGCAELQTRPCHCTRRRMRRTVMQDGLTVWLGWLLCRLRGCPEQNPRSQTIGAAPRAARRVCCQRSGEASQAVFDHTRFSVPYRNSARRAQCVERLVNRALLRRCRCRAIPVSGLPLGGARAHGRHASPAIARRWLRRALTQRARRAQPGPSPGPCICIGTAVEVPQPGRAVHSLPRRGPPRSLGPLAIALNRDLPRAIRLRGSCRHHVRTRLQRARM